MPHRPDVAPSQISTLELQSKGGKRDDTFFSSPETSHEVHDTLVYMQTNEGCNALCSTTVALPGLLRADEESNLNASVRVCVRGSVGDRACAQAISDSIIRLSVLRTARTLLDV